MQVKQQISHKSHMNLAWAATLLDVVILYNDSKLRIWGKLQSSDNRQIY